MRIYKTKMIKKSVSLLLFYTCILPLIGCTKTAYRLRTNAQVAPSGDLLLATETKQQQAHALKDPIQGVGAPDAHYHLAVEEVKEVEREDGNGRNVKQLSVVFVVSKR